VLFSFDKVSFAFDETLLYGFVDDVFSSSTMCGNFELFQDGLEFLVSVKKINADPSFIFLLDSLVERFFEYPSERGEQGIDEGG
jgi:hypothetical protein